MNVVVIVALLWQAAPPLDKVGVDQKLGNPVPLDLVFRDESGRPITLRAAAAGKPVVLAPVYYRCPQLCTQVLNGLLVGLKGTIPRAGKQFQVLTVSFDPKEDAALASAKKAAYLKRYDRPDAAEGWRFLTGDSSSIDALLNSIGYRTVVDPSNGRFAHPSAIVVLTPDGRVSRYFFGIEYPPRDLRLAIAEASEGKSGSFVDPLLLLCYQYDPATGRYGVAILRILKLAGIATVIALGLGILSLARRHRRSPRAAGLAPAE